MRNLLFWGQILIATLLVSAILLQQRGVGLGSAFGGGGEIYRSKRGLEKILFISTLVLATLFIAGSFLSFIIS
ncbi:preprotein translocase subunit SecG [Candidatus Giovannonibacteria bacterium]|nr:preprotein translocase subunit SecG [Candidatus Giovannonibacteria bacterium]